MEIVEWGTDKITEWYNKEIHTMDEAVILGRQLIDMNEKVDLALGILFMHVEKHSGGRSLKGGRSELARQLEIPESTMRRYVDAVKGKARWANHTAQNSAIDGGDLVELEPTKYAQIEQAPRPEAVIEYVVDTVSDTGKVPSLSDIRQVVKTQKYDDRVSNLTGIPRMEGLYDLIVSDPPWPRRDYEWDPDPDRSSWQGRMAFRPYPPMTYEAIKEMEIPAAENCVLWLWITNHNLLELKSVIEAWGFEYKCTLTWVKNRFGTGFWLRGQTEHCALAIKGEVPWKVGNVSTVLNAKLREDSRKPDEFYELAERMSPWAIKKLDMFSRQPRKGWAQFGDEVEKYKEE